MTLGKIQYRPISGATDVCIVGRRVAKPNLNTIAATWCLRYAPKIPSCDAGLKKILMTLEKIQYRPISGATGVCIVRRCAVESNLNTIAATWHRGWTQQFAVVTQGRNMF